MALVSCPECQKKISDQSSSCPNCGYPLNESKIIVKPLQGCFMQTLNAGCIIIIIIIVIAFFFAGVATLYKFNQSSKHTDKTELNSNKIIKNSSNIN